MAHNASPPRRQVVSAKRDYTGNWWDCTLSCGHVQRFGYWTRMDNSHPKTMACAPCVKSSENGRDGSG